MKWQKWICSVSSYKNIVNVSASCLLVFFARSQTDFHSICTFLIHLQRNLTFSCVDSHTFPVFFNATSFLQLSGRREHNMVSVGFQFRTWNPNGLLLFSSLADGMLEISLNDGKVTAHVNVTEQKNSRVDIASGRQDLDLLFHPHVARLHQLVFLLFRGKHGLKSSETVLVIHH